MNPLCKGGPFLTQSQNGGPRSLPTTPLEVRLGRRIAKLELQRDQCQRGAGESNHEARRGHPSDPHLPAGAHPS